MVPNAEGLTECDADAWVKLPKFRTRKNSAFAQNPDMQFVALNFSGFFIIVYSHAWTLGLDSSVGWALVH